MLPTELISVLPVTSVHPSTPAEAIGDAQQEAFQRSLQTLLGKSVQGQVLARLTDGSFMVKVAGASARMMLPGAPQVGAQVPMTLVAINPRPTFQIGGSAQALPTLPNLPAGPAPTGPESGPVDLALLPTSLAAALLGKAPLTATGELLDFDPSAPATMLSSAARAITMVLATAQSGPNPALSILGKTPLVTTPTAPPEQLAQQLRAALSTSGLFYESHVALWAGGKFTLPELMQEPQMQQAQQGSYVAGAAPSLAAAQMIDLQLHTQEQARVQWQGEAWPGQGMQWEIQKDAPQGGHDGEAAPAPAAWRSGVRFQFPLLGSVSASIVLSGDRVHIQMQTASTASAHALRGGAGALEQALEAAGAPLSSLTIREAIDGK